MTESEPPLAPPGVHAPESGANSESNNANKTNSSAEMHGSNSKKKFVFNLQDAFDKKMESREKYINKISNKKWDFSNCCMLSFDKAFNFKADQVFKSIKEALTEAEYSAIQAIGQYASTKNWAIQFNSESAFKTSLNRQITIDDVRSILKDANEFGRSIESAEERVYKMTAFFRIHWLPSNFYESDIKKFMAGNANFLSIMDLRKEKSIIDEKIDNGIFKIKVEYDVKFHQKVLDFAGTHVLFGQNALFQLTGMPVKCLYCKTFGHVRRNCPKANSYCNSCKRNGHETSKCSMANRTAPPDQNLENLDEDNFVGDNQAETTPSSANFSETTPLSADFSETTPSLANLSETIENVVNFKVPESNPGQTLEVKKELLQQKFAAKYAAEKAEKAKKTLEKKKSKAAKQQEDEQIQFNQAILEIEKKGFPRLKAIEEFEKMNEAAKNALLEKFQVQTPYKALKRTTSSTKLTGNKSKSSKTTEANGNVSGSETDSSFTLFTDTENEENGKSGNASGQFNLN